MIDNLKKHRQEIDKIDKLIVRLIADRIKVVKKIGRYKKKKNMPPLQPKRWQEVLDSKKELARQLGLGEKMIEEIYELIHKYCLKVESE